MTGGPVALCEALEERKDKKEVKWVILSDREIRRRIREQQLIVGADDGQINPASVNLCLGDTYLLQEYELGGVQLGHEVKYQRVQTDGLILEPQQFVLATTRERVNMPGDLSAFVQGRSSIGRVGLTVQNAGFVDPGFTGHITLELVNESMMPIVITEGYPVAQLVFFETLPVEHAYSGKYSGQVEATGSRMHMDREARREHDGP